MKHLFYFLAPYVLAWILLWVSLPLVRLYRALLLHWIKKRIEKNPAIGYEVSEGNLVLKWHVFTIRYAILKDPATGQKNIHYISVRERLSSVENALRDLHRFSRALARLLKKFFMRKESL